MSVRALLMLAALLPCVPMAFFRPFFGVIVWTIISFASPQWYAWGAASYFPSAELIAIPTILGFLVFNPGWMGRLISRESVLIVLLWLWFTVTSVISTSSPVFESHAEITWFRYTFVSKVLLMVFITMATVNSFARLRTLIIVTASCFTFYVAKAVPFIIATAGTYRLYGPPHSMVEDNNDLGLALNMTVPMLFFLAQTETSARVRRLFWFLFVAVIIGVFCTYSRGALLGLVAVMGLMLLQLKQRAVLIPVIILAGLVVTLFAPQKWQDRMNFTEKGATFDKSAYSRLNAWTFAWNLAKEYPITGGGFDTFQKDLFDRWAPNSEDVHGPHSIYFGVLGEHGWVGLFLYLSVVVSAFASAAKVRKEAHYRGDEVVASYANMLQFSLIGFLVSGAFLGRAYFDYYFTIVCYIVILKRECFAVWRQGDAEPEVTSGAAA